MSSNDEIFFSSPFLDHWRNTCGVLQLTTEEEIGMPVEFVGADDPSLGKQFSTTALACAFLGCSPADLGSAVLSQSEVWTAIKNNKNNSLFIGFLSL